MITCMGRILSTKRLIGKRRLWSDGGRFGRIPDVESTGEDLDEEIYSYVAACPITPEFARRIVGLMDLPWDDPKVADRAMLDLGWRDDGEVPMDECRFVTDLGHFVHGDHCLYMPFAHFYDVGGELWPQDGWGTEPGWSSRKDAGRADFDACVDAAVDRFAEVLGPPEADVRTEGT